MTALRGYMNTNVGKAQLGYKGERGYSAYELAVRNGYEGTEEEWIEHFGLDLSGYVQTSDVVDNVTSTETTHPLSAKQGKLLNDSITSLSTNKLNKSDVVDLPSSTSDGKAFSSYGANTLKNSILANDGHIGTLSNLETTSKSNLVSAINELHDNEEEVDITSQITWYESIANTHVIKKGKMIFVYYQGEAKTHAANDVLCKFPDQYIPVMGQQYAPFVVNNNAYGTLFINNSGNISIGMISSTSINGRIYANFSFYIG